MSEDTLPAAPASGPEIRPGAHEAARPDWTNRRKIVFCALRHDMAAIWATLLAAIGLAIGDKFDGWIATFLLVAFLVVACHSVLIIGSYVFGAAWEGARFMGLVERALPAAPGKGGAP